MHCGARPVTDSLWQRGLPQALLEGPPPPCLLAQFLAQGVREEVQTCRSLVNILSAACSKQATTLRQGGGVVASPVYSCWRVAYLVRMIQQQ